MTRPTRRASTTLTTCPSEVTTKSFLAICSWTVAGTSIVYVSPTNRL